MFAGIVTVPSGFNINPSGIVVPVSVTFPGADPITTSTPFKVSLAVKAVVVPPVVPLIGPTVSITASIPGAETTIVETTESQFVGLLTSHI